MSDEIEEFIRRAAERRRQGQGQQRKQQQQRPVQQQPPQPPKRARLAQPEVVEAEIVSAEVIEDVATHVNRHLDSRDFEQRASHFGEQPALADDKVEARLHQTFDHQLGRLAQAPVVSPATSRSTTDNAAIVTSGPTNQMLTFLVKALSSPQEFRQAFILSEILARPADRWE